MVDILSDIKIRPAQFGEIIQHVELMNSQYNRKKDPAYFEWQFFKSIYPSVLMSAFLGTELIGMFGFQKRVLTNGAKIGQAIDLLIKPEWRGKGLFKKLAEETTHYFTDLDLYCVFPNLNGKNACDHTLGWQTLAKIDTLTLTLPFKSLQSDQFSQLGDLIGFTYDQEVKKWRFDQNPTYMYSHHQSPDNEIIYKKFVDPKSQEVSHDLVFYQADDITSLAKIMANCCQVLQKQNATAITTWALPHTPIFKALIESGFMAVPQERYFCVKVLNNKYHNLSQINNWYLLQSDAEIY